MITSAKVAMGATCDKLFDCEVIDCEDCKVSSADVDVMMLALDVDDKTLYDELKIVLVVTDAPSTMVMLKS